jgi:hypothetical protein
MTGVRSGIGLSCELCTIGVEPRRKIIMADFVHLIAAIGGLEAMIIITKPKYGSK